MRCRVCGAGLPADAMFCGECGSSTSATPESRRRRGTGPGDTTVFDRSTFRTTGVVSVPVPELDAGGGRDAEDAVDLGVLTRFELRLDSGEVRVVFGSGLVGRRPTPEPGERFDHLVQLDDPTLSVSKTHLEFGAHDEVLWVADRFSANGTVIARPGREPLRCEPGRRYLAPLGTRVQLAGRAFVVT